MSLEQRWSTILPTLLTSNGTSFGVVTIVNTTGFKDKQKIYIQSNTLPQKEYQIKRVISSTQFIVGPVDNKVSPNDFSDISMYTTADSAKVGAVEQPKMALPPEKDHYSGIYEGSPTNADRVISVDEFGNPYNADNPYPIAFDGTISVGKVQVEGTNTNTIEPNPDGSINVNVLTGSVNLDPTIVNIPVPLANTEQSFTFPAKTTRFYIKPRSSYNKMQIAYTSGGSSTNFITVGMGNSYAEETNMGGKTIYFQLTNASQIIELLYWKQP